MVDCRRVLCVIFAVIGGLALLVAPSATGAQETVKIGAILPMTGPFQSTGAEADAAIRLFLAQRGSIVAGKKIEIVLRDDRGVPADTKRLAQELFVKDHVQILIGFGLTPCALAVAPIATEAKVRSTPVIFARSSSWRGIAALSRACTLTARDNARGCRPGLRQRQRGPRFDYTS